MPNTAFIPGPGIYALDRGVPMRVVGGATATGTANSVTFAVPVIPTGADCSVTLSSFETAITVLTIDLQKSDDGGATFQPYKTALNVHSGPQTVTPCPPGLYRVNIASITGTSTDINAIQS